MAIIKQKDKRSGITYVYNSVSFWDKEKKQSRAKRTLLGRLDEETGEIIPTDGRGRKEKESEHTLIKVENKIEQIKRSFYGATYLFDKIGEKIGLTDDLKKCFPENYKKILSIAYYLILEDSTPLSRFEKWSSLHKHPYGSCIASQRSSELFASITEDEKNMFFKYQGKRRVDNEYWAYDTSSISSYSEQLKQVQYGKNKDGDSLPQLNLALVYGEESGLPFYYRKLAGNIPDSKTVKTLINELNVLGFSKIKLVMDRGFYSEANINQLYKGHIKFLVGTKMSISFIKNHLESITNNIKTFENYNEKYELYMQTIQADWKYTEYKPNKKETSCSNKKIYIHYYFNIDKAAEEEKKLDRELKKLKSELETGKTKAENQKRYEKYFKVKETSKNGETIKNAVVIEEAVKKTKKYLGYFVLLSNEKMDGNTALEIYRNKDVVEKAFSNLKDRLNMRRNLVSSEQSLEGKIFVQFIALIIVSYIKKQMEINNVFKNYTMQEVFDKLDIIECFEVPGQRLKVGEILEKQLSLYKLLGVNPPNSL